MGYNVVIVKNDRWFVRLNFSLIGFLCLVSALILGYTPAEAQTDPPSQLIHLVNQLRISSGQLPYQVDPILMIVAQNQANWLAGGNNTGHLGPDGRLPHERAKAAGYGGGEDSFAVENAAQGTMELHTPELVVNMWQGDYGHLSAMISPKYEHIGVGYAVETDMSWFVMVVGWTGSEGVASNSTGDTNPTVVVPEEPPSVNPQVINTPDPGGSIYHEVQPGNTIWKISEEYGVNIWKLLEQNGLTYESIIQPGDLILIESPPIPTNTPEPTLSPTLFLTQTITLQVVSQTEGARVPDATSIPWTSVELNAPFQRNTLLIIFLVIGSGLLILAFMTVLANSRVF